MTGSTATVHSVLAAMLLGVLTAGCPRQDPASNLEAARHALAAYLEAWRTLDFRTMHGLTIAGALAGKSVEVYERDANKTLLENAVVASHMRYEIGDGVKAPGGAVVPLEWTLPNMAMAVKSIADLSLAGTGPREMLDAVAARVEDGTIPLETHTRSVTLKYEDGRWKVDPTALQVSSHYEKTP